MINVGLTRLVNIIFKLYSLMPRYGKFLRSCFFNLVERFVGKSSTLVEQLFVEQLSLDTTCRKLQVVSRLSCSTNSCT
jgi:hypothetical protein